MWGQDGLDLFGLFSSSFRDVKKFQMSEITDIPVRQVVVVILTVTHYFNFSWFILYNKKLVKVWGHICELNFSSLLRNQTKQAAEFQLSLQSNGGLSHVSDSTHETHQNKMPAELTFLSLAESFLIF